MPWCKRETTAKHSSAWWFHIHFDKQGVGVFVKLLAGLTARDVWSTIYDELGPSLRVFTMALILSLFKMSLLPGLCNEQSGIKVMEEDAGHATDTETAISCGQIHLYRHLTQRLTKTSITEHITSVEYFRYHLIHFLPSRGGRCIPQWAIFFKMAAEPLGGSRWNFA